MGEPILPGLEPRAIKLPLWATGLELLDGMGCQKAEYKSETLEDNPHFTIYWRCADEAMRSDWREECAVLESGASPNSGTLTIYPSLPEALRRVTGGDPYNKNLWDACIHLGEISRRDAERIQIDLAFLVDAPWPEHIDPLAD